MLADFKANDFDVKELHQSSGDLHDHSDIAESALQSLRKEVADLFKADVRLVVERVMRANENSIKESGVKVEVGMAAQANADSALEEPATRSLFCRMDPTEMEFVIDNLVGNAAVGAFVDGTFDEVRVIYASFVSTMTQKPVERPLLPIAPDAVSDGGAENEESSSNREYIWEPSQAEMFATLLPLYLKNRVFMTLSEAFTSEHAARMTSMSAATENAGEMIDALTLQRNRERQATITSELLDIVGGANAL